MSGAVESGAGESIGLGKAVTLVAAAAVLVAVAVVAWSRLTSDEDPALAADELEPALLTSTEVGEAATVPGPYEQEPYETSIESILYRLDNGLVAEEPALPECNDLIRRVLPDARDQTEGVAFRRPDDTLVLHALDLIDDDQPIPDLVESCFGTWAEAPGPTLVLMANGRGVDGLGDDAISVHVDAYPVVNGQMGQDQPYLDVVVFVRDGVVSTVTVARGTNLSDPSDLAVSVAKAADTKLTTTSE